MTGLHYLNARYYNPDEAVFLSQDSYRGDKTDSTTWNLYAYCAGNPVKYVDPSGHYVETIYDAYSFGDSLIELIRDPSLENAWWAAFDAASIIAPIPAGGKVARAADDAVDAVRAGNKVVDGVKGAKKVKVKPKVSKKVKRVKKASKTPKIKSKKGSVKKSAKTKGKSRVVSKLNTGKWNKGSFDSAEDSLNNHYRKHGDEVGASTPEEYLRKAEEFAKNAKKGSKKSKIRGSVEGVIRYKKNGKYIDLAPDGSIISFGKQ